MGKCCLPVVGLVPDHFLPSGQPPIMHGNGIQYHAMLRFYMLTVSPCAHDVVIAVVAVAVPFIVMRNDHEHREAFTQNFVKSMVEQLPAFDVIMCSVRGECIGMSMCA